MTCEGPCGDLSKWYFVHEYNVKIGITVTNIELKKLLFVEKLVNIVRKAED